MAAKRFRLPDELIDDALGQQPTAGVPHGFHRRLERRLALAALADAERRRFRSAVSSALACAAFVCIAAALPFAFDFHGWVADHVPGFLGRLDYFTISFGRTLPAGVSALGGGILAALGAASIAGLFLMRSLRTA